MGQMKIWEVDELCIQYNLFLLLTKEKVHISIFIQDLAHKHLNMVLMNTIKYYNDSHMIL